MTDLEKRMSNTFLQRDFTRVCKKVISILYVNYKGISQNSYKMSRSRLEEFEEVTSLCLSAILSQKSLYTGHIVSRELS